MVTKVLIGSKNPVKIEATKEAFERFFDDVVVEGVSVESGVPGQPRNEETYEGSKNRALALKELHPDASFYVGIEGGIEQTNNTWYSFASIHIIDNKGRMGYGKTTHFVLPQAMINRVIKGEELGTVMDEYLGKFNVKHGQGAAGTLTKGAITRKDFCVQGLTMALVPFLNEEMYFTQ